MLAGSIFIDIAALTYQLKYSADEKINSLSAFYAVDVLGSGPKQNRFG